MKFPYTIYCYAQRFLAFFLVLVSLTALGQEPPANAAAAEALMEDARIALASKNFDKAILLYTRVIAGEDTQYQPLALEFMGVAREKKGQLAHAKAIYEQFLKKYPLDGSAPRVRQRLNALITSASQPKQPLREAKKNRTKNTLEWHAYGGLSQYYRYADLKLKDTIRDEETSIDIESSLSSDLFYTVRGRNQSWDIEFRLGAGYLNDFLPDSNDEDRLSELYAEVENRDFGHALRIGRQRGKGAGVLGRFDGVYTEFSLTEKHQLNLIYGYPVASTNDVAINSDKSFYGINLDFGPYHGWEFTPFYIKQDNEIAIDRQAIGIETRYFDNEKSLFTLIDYDLEFDELNTLLAIGSIRATEKTTFTFNIDFRKSPVLTLSNALQGQPEQTLEALSLRFSEDELLDIARDRTTDSTLVSAGINHRFNTTWSIYSSIMMNKLSDMPASAGIEALPGTDNEWSYEIQLISTGLILDNDTGIYSLRHFDGTTSQRYALNLDYRYPFSRDWRINPRLRVDLRQNTSDNNEQWVYRPSVKTTYRHHRKYHFEFEIGGEWSTRELVGENEEKSKGLFGSIGYRIDL